MPTETVVSHHGVVTKTDGSAVTVSIISTSACAACHMNGGCPASESQEKQVIVTTPHAATFSLGETVTVEIQSRTALVALLVGYVVPCVMVVAALCVALMLTKNETLAGVWALLALVPYYGIVYLFRGFLKKIFVVNLIKDPALS